MFGDPHFSTTDGLEYSWNGVGELYLIKADTFILQARTQQAWDDQEKPIRASVFTAFAAQDLTEPAPSPSGSRDTTSSTSSPQIHVGLDRDRKGTILSSWFNLLTDYLTYFANCSVYENNDLRLVLC